MVVYFGQKKCNCWRLRIHIHSSTNIQSSKTDEFYFHIILSPILVCIVSHLFKTLAIKKCPKRSRHGTPRRCGRSSLLVAKMASYFLHLQFCTIFSSANSITTFIFLPNVKTLSTQSNKIFAKCNNRRAALYTYRAPYDKIRLLNHSWPVQF